MRVRILLSALDDACLVYAAGCVEHVLPLADGAEIRIPLTATPAPPSACAATETCDRGECTAGAGDGGLPDGGAPDTGSRDE